MLTVVLYISGNHYDPAVIPQPGAAADTQISVYHEGGSSLEGKV